MSIEEDNFDIDIYGDGDGDGETEQNNEQNGGYKEDDEVEFQTEEPNHSQIDGAADTQNDSHTNGIEMNDTQPVEGTNGHTEYPKQPPQQQGIKRKETSDERSIDPGATTALLVSDLHWWSTEDDIRGWANQAGCEDELKDVTFSEHKVNGKSKGQAFVEFASPYAASATKHKVDSIGGGQPNSRKFTITYTNPMQNPFKTLPKDGPMRGKDDRPQRSTSTGGYNAGAAPQNNFNMNGGGGYRGGRGGGYNRGGMNNNSFNNNRNFNNMGGGFNNNSNPGMGGGFQPNPMGMMNNFGNFNNRGGMMGNNMRGGNAGGMRGGRGGMGGMPMMGNMGMGMGMPMGGMNPMMAGMNMSGQGGFQGNTHFNPAFYNQNNPAAATGDSSWNPHKRPRQE